MKGYSKHLFSITIMVRNIVEKGENASYQHFVLFPQYSQKAFSSGLSKIVINVMKKCSAQEP